MSNWFCSLFWTTFRVRKMVRALLNASRIYFFRRRGWNSKFILSQGHHFSFGLIIQILDKIKYYKYHFFSSRSGLIRMMLFRHFSFPFLFIKGCNDFKYGLECKETCGDCYQGEQCNHVTGVCLNGCDAGVYGDKCVMGKIWLYKWPIVFLLCTFFVSVCLRKKCVPPNVSCKTSFIQF